MLLRIYSSNSIVNNENNANDSKLITSLDKQKNQRNIENIFLPINFNIYFGCSKEPSY